MFYYDCAHPHGWDGSPPIPANFRICTSHPNTHPPLMYTCTPITITSPLFSHSHILSPTSLTPSNHQISYFSLTHSSSLLLFFLLVITPLTKNNNKIIHYHHSKDWFDIKFHQPLLYLIQIKHKFTIYWIFSIHLFPLPNHIHFQP